MNNKEHKETYYLVREDILTEALLKTIEAKNLLSKNEVNTISEAVKKVGLSRSAFYKYKDGVFPFNAMMKEKIVTISINLEHKSGLLSALLSFVAKSGGNILTINQTIPLQEIANVIISIDTVNMEIGLTELIDSIRNMQGVNKVQLIGRG